jgi:predicted RNA-binding Zn-ribbon protein involved in translation (DUF1610 family)
MSGPAGDLVPENAIDYAEVFRRGGRNLGDEDFAVFKCPTCGQVYLLEYEVDTVYLDPNDLSRRLPVHSDTFDCVTCGQRVPDDEPWVGPKASPRFGVTWGELRRSDWRWVARSAEAPTGGTSGL